jgi:acyl-CoA thioesterase II
MSSDIIRAAVGVEVGADGIAYGRTDLGGVERQGVYGGQLVAQALSAAGRTAPSGSVPDSIHAYLIGASLTGEPVAYHVEAIRDGRALQHRRVRGVQDGKLVLEATVVSTMPADGADWQAPVRPPAGAPDLRPDAPTAMYAFLGWNVFDIVAPATVDDIAPPDHPFWLRSRVDAGDDPWLWGAVHVFWSDLGLNGAARFLHDDVAGPTSSVSANHAVWLHRRASPGDWHLFDVAPVSLAGNQGYVHGALFHESGALVASVNQRVFIRRPPSD